jgi:hypothetical protein
MICLPRFSSQQGSFFVLPMLEVRKAENQNDKFGGKNTNSVTPRASSMGDED